MKFKQLLLITLCITFFTCNIESVDNQEDEKTVDATLLKKVIYDKGTADEYTETYNYIDGNKLASIDAGDGYKTIYTYEDDKLVREDTYFDDELAVYVTVEYNSEGVLTKFIEYWFESTGLSKRAYKKIFAHNNNNTITQEIFQGNHDSQTDFFYTGTISFNGKNISRIKDHDDNFDLEHIYSYDDKNGMFKNVHAIDVLNLLTENEFGSNIYGNTNNIINELEKYNGQTTEYSFEYVYNENEYPVSGTYKYINNGVIDEDQTVTMEFFYE